MKSNFNEFKKFVKGKTVGLVGVGVSNLPLIDTMINYGARVLACDGKPSSEFQDIVEEYRNKPVEFMFGEDYLSDLKNCDILFKTPGMRIDSKEIIEAKNNGVYVTSEMEEFLKYTKGKVYAVTGSDGKTTTTTILSKLLESSGYKTWVGGNIGTPLFSKIEEIGDNDKVVLELSSFQLMTLHEKIDIAVVTNLTPNHLDMHKSMDEYIDAKKNICRFQSSECVLVVNADDKIASSFAKETPARIKKFSSKSILSSGAYVDNGHVYINDYEVVSVADMKIKGMHNVENFMAAFLAAEEDIDMECMDMVFKTFSGVEHRNEYVRTLNGVDFYNDSIASSPTRTVASLKSFGKRVILLAGGYDKNIPFDVLASDGGKYIKELILFGNTKDKIRNVFYEYNKAADLKVSVSVVNNMEEAIALSCRLAKQGDVVALSPACASFDMYKNFMVRGKIFKDIINSL